MKCQVVAIDGKCGCFAPGVLKVRCAKNLTVGMCACNAGMTAILRRLSGKLVHLLSFRKPEAPKHIETLEDRSHRLRHVRQPTYTVELMGAVLKVRKDVIKVERIILGMDVTTVAADANGDETVIMGDVTKIERVILEIEKETLWIERLIFKEVYIIL